MDQNQIMQEKLQRALETGTKEEVAAAAFAHGERIGRFSTSAPEMEGSELYAIWRDAMAMNSEGSRMWEELTDPEKIAWETSARTAAGQLRRTQIGNR